jgi:hypothetical protein
LVYLIEDVKDGECDPPVVWPPQMFPSHKSESIHQLLSSLHLNLQLLIKKPLSFSGIGDGIFIIFSPCPFYQEVVGV